jgi:hypothetical protein
MKQLLGDIPRAHRRKSPPRRSASQRTSPTPNENFILDFRIRDDHSREESELEALLRELGWRLREAWFVQYDDDNSDPFR